MCAVVALARDHVRRGTLSVTTGGGWCCEAGASSAVYVRAKIVKWTGYQERARVALSIACFLALVKALVDANAISLAVLGALMVEPNVTKRETLQASPFLRNDGCRSGAAGDVMGALLGIPKITRGRFFFRCWGGKKSPKMAPKSGAIF